MLARHPNGSVVSRLLRGSGEVLSKRQGFFPRSERQLGPGSPSRQQGFSGSPSRQQGFSGSPSRKQGSRWYQRQLAFLPNSLDNLPRRCAPTILSSAVFLLLALVANIASSADLAEATEAYRTGKFTECIAAATELVTQNEYHEPAWVLKIQSELELGRYADAAKSLDAGLAKLTGSIQLRWLGLTVCRHTQQAERAEKLNEEIKTLLQQSAWRYSDIGNQLIVGRWMLSQRVDAKQVLTKIYNDAKKRLPSHVDIWLAIGDLALEKHDYQLAGEAFQQASKLDATSAAAHFGVAQAFAPSDTKKAEKSLHAALAINANHVGSLLLIADEHIDSERYDDAEKVLVQVGTVNPQHPKALAYRAVIAHLRNKLDDEQKLRAAALKTWPTNPEVDYTIGRKLSQKYRFAEGAAYQRQALKFAPEYLAAKAQLAQDLLRLGQEEEGLKLAEEVYEADGYNVFAHNMVALQEQLAKFRTLEGDGLLVRMDAREADIYGQRVLSLLTRAKQELCAKYAVTLDQPIIVEMFPRQQDFAIRTFGMPGGSGFLGVCFGTVITAPSPASQTTSPACWEATLWHEFCHVVTLTKTKNKMPRWLSEGISVYEEGEEDRTWGQAITPKYREMLLGDDLTPVSQLSGAFLHASSPTHLQFAYFESSLVVKYLVEKYGREMLQRALVDLSVGMPINESLGRYTGSIAALDADFAKYARDTANKMAPQADWTEPELPMRASVEVISAWLKEHPTNYVALQRLAQAQITAKDWPSAKATLAKMIELYPEDARGRSPYVLLSVIYKQEMDVAQERAMLEKLASLDASELAAFERLTELAAAANDWPTAKKYVLRSLAVNPLHAATHRSAAEAGEQLQDYELAADSYRALLLLEPFDFADLHFKTATALKNQGNLPAAKRHALLALEETPRFRAAQQLLLDIVTVLPVESKEAKPPASSPVPSPARPSPAKPSPPSTAPPEKPQ